ncbi:MAG: hypothetical protein IJS65_08620 [Clostridia bacterium]|nr:hypothetical protein [Clostridia bacterium]
MKVSLSERIVSALSYLWILFFLPLLLIPRSSFGRFHANQALLNLLWGIVAGVLSKLLANVPLIGGVLSWILSFLLAVFPIWGIVCSLLGLKKPFPIIGGITLIK